MKKILMIGGVLVMVILLHFGFAEEVMTYAGGPPTAKTGSPGDGNDCTMCHSGTAQQTPGLITSNVPVEGYDSDSTYTISVSISALGKSKFGFQASAQTLTGGKMGTLIATNTVTTQLAGAGKYIHQTSGGTAGTDGKTWTFDWIPPSAGSGDLSFYASVNVTNSNNVASGDVIHLSSILIIEDPANAPGTSATDDVATVVENGNVIIDVQANDVSFTGNPLTTTVVSQPSNGTAITLNDDSLHYVTSVGFVGSDTIVYSICDNSTPALCDTAMVIITVTPLVGVAEKSKHIDIRVFPNPATKRLFIEMEVNVEEILLIRDLMGNFVEVKEYREGKYRVIDVSELAGGIYLLEIKNLLPKKFLVIR